MRCSDYMICTNTYEHSTITDVGVEDSNDYDKNS